MRERDELEEKAERDIEKLKEEKEAEIKRMQEDRQTKQFGLQLASSECSLAEHKMKDKEQGEQARTLNIPHCDASARCRICICIYIYIYEKDCLERVLSKGVE